MSLGVYTLVCEVVLVDAIVTSQNVSWHFAATRQRSTELFLALVPPKALKKTSNDEELVILRFILLVPPTTKPKDLDICHSNKKGES
jgi:hypothetical protein